MKTLTKFALAAVIVCTAFAAKAQYVSYYRTSYTYVQPSYSSSYTTYTYTPRYTTSCGSGYSGLTSVYGSSTRIGGTTFHNYSSSVAGHLSGTTTTFGNTSFTTRTGW